MKFCSKWKVFTFESKFKKIDITKCFKDKNRRYLKRIDEYVENVKGEKKMSNQLEVFKLRLEQLKDMGVDVDPEKIAEEIMKPQIPEDKTEEEKEAILFDLAKAKAIEFIDDYHNFYKPKGRKLRVIIEVIKKNCADKFGERFVYSDDLEVVTLIGIGTKGKYEKVLEEE